MYHPERRWRTASPSALRMWITFVALAVLLCANVVAADGLHQTYCSPDNTASDFDASILNSIFMSNGRCMNNCTDINPTYAFAVVQGQNCWCGDYAPADQVSVGQCNVNCVGYPPEQCGNQDAGLFGYLVIGTPSGTVGASSPSSTQAPQSSSTPTTSRIRTTPTTSSSTSSTSTTSLTSSTAATTSTTPSPSPVWSVQVITVSNRPVTQTVTSVPTITSANSGNLEAVQQKSGVSAGLIAGVVIAGVVAALAVAGLLFFCWRRRKQQQQQLEADSAATMVGSGAPSTRPTRNTSVLSKTGLLERVYPSAAMAQRSHANSNAPEMAGGVSPISERRRSQPLFYDQRLNPTTLMNFDNGSRVSVNTLPDNRDFSRTLNVTNPDPHDSWHA